VQPRKHISSTERKSSNPQESLSSAKTTAENHPVKSSNRTRQARKPIFDLLTRVNEHPSIIWRAQAPLKAEGNKGKSSSMTTRARAKEVHVNLM
jgi:hypothetical protein